MIDLVDQRHRAGSVLRGATGHRTVSDNRVGEAADLLVPGGITVVARDLLLRISAVLVRISGADGQRCRAVALGPGEDAAENDAAPLQVDVEMEPVPPLGRGRVE